MIPDNVLLQKGVTIRDLQVASRDRTQGEAAQRRAALLLNLASISKRFILEKLAFEELLSVEGVKEVSAAIYSAEWAAIYYRAIESRERWNKRGYWKRLYDAVLNRKFYI